MIKTLIEGSNNYYVTTCGRVFRGDKELRKNKTHEGYRFVSIKFLDGRRKNYPVHRLVALTYLPNPENKPFVNHLNLIKWDNRLENLEWVTPAENLKHAHDSGAFRHNGVHYLAKHQDELIHRLCSLIQEGRRDCDIATLLNVDRHLVSDIRHEKIWMHISKDYVLLKSRIRRFSDQTAKWVCEMILQNKTPKEINELSKGKIPRSMVKDIKQKKSYRDISCNYFN